MRGFLLGAIALVAACGGDGVYIEVRVPAGMTVDQVDLYLATGDCKPDEVGFCEGIVPPAGASVKRDRVEGEVYFVDDNRPFVSVPDGDGTAWFHLDPSSQFEIKTAIAVGHDPSGGASGVAIFQQIDLDVTQHLRVDLEPVASKEVRGMAQPAVEVWGPTNDDYRCVAAEVENRVVYIVPRNDPDCDEVARVGECLPGVHLGQQPVSSDLREQTCTTSEPTGLCVLGSESCDERSPSGATGCTASTDKKYCTTDRACLVCGDSLDANCVQELFSLGSVVQCTVEVEPDPVGGPATRTCVNKNVTVGTISDLPCTQPEIALADDVLGFASNVTAPIPNAAIGARLKPIVEPDCRLGLEALDAKFPSSASQQPIHSMIKLDVTPPGESTPRFLILPLKIVFVTVQQNCEVDMASACQLLKLPNDHFPLCFE